MANEKTSPLSGLLKFLGGLVTAEIAKHGTDILEFGEEKITELFNKHAEAIAAHADDVHPCPTGQRWSDALGKCVDDPTAR